MRASDQDRDKVAGVLSDAYAAGRLSRDELDERCAAAYRAQTYGELQDLAADLPAPPECGLPSDIVARRDATRRAFAPMLWMCLIVLAAGLAGRIFPDAVLVIAVASAAPVLLFAVRRNRIERPRRHRIR
jgi:hypothetical protein